MSNYFISVIIIIFLLTTCKSIVKIGIAKFGLVFVTIEETVNIKCLKTLKNLNNVLAVSKI
jgi:hypothetical protein